MSRQETKNRVEVKITDTISVSKYVAALRKKTANGKPFSTFNSCGFASVIAVEQLTDEALSYLGAVIHVLLGERAAQGSKEAESLQKTLCEYGAQAQEMHISHMQEENLRKTAIALGFGDKDGNISNEAFAKFKVEVQKISRKV